MYIEKIHNMFYNIIKHKLKNYSKLLDFGKDLKDLIVIIINLSHWNSTLFYPKQTARMQKKSLNVLVINWGLLMLKKRIMFISAFHMLKQPFKKPETNWKHYRKTH